MRGIIWLAVLIAAMALGLSTAAVEAGEPVPTPTPAPTPTPENGLPADCPAAGSNQVTIQATATDILLDDDGVPGGTLTSVGGATFTGPATITNSDCYVQIIIDTAAPGSTVIDIEIVSMSLTGSVQGIPVTFNEDPANASTGKFVDNDPFDFGNSFFPASGFMNLFWTMFSQTFNTTLTNCAGADPFVTTQDITDFPPNGATFEGADLEMCSLNPGHLITVKGPMALVITAVGGIAEPLGDSTSPSAPAASSGSGFNYAALAGGLAAAALAVAVAGGWYARRRWLW